MGMRDAIHYIYSVAVRSPIELIDGEKLIDMLASLELGLRPVKTYEVDTAFFNEFEG